MRRILKIIAGTVLLLIVVCVTVLVVVTRSSFIQAVVLPRLGAKIGTEITVESLSFSPTSEISFTNLRVGPSSEPFLEVETGECRYDLWQLMKGVLWIDALTLRGGQVYLIKYSDGQWNFPSSVSEKEENEPESAEEAEASPRRVHIENVSVSEFTINANIALEDNEQLTAEFANVSFKVPRIVNSETVQAEAGVGELQLEMPQLKVTNGKIAFEAIADLDADLRPENFQSTLEITHLAGNASDTSLAGHSLMFRTRGTMDSEGIKWNVEELQIEEYSNKTLELAISSEGEFTISPFTMDFAVAIDPISAELLNLASTFVDGYNFGQTHGSYSGNIRLDPNGAIYSKGSLELLDTTIRRPDAALPEFDPFKVTAQHEFELDLEKGQVELQAADVKISQNQKTLLSLNLLQPFAIKSGNEAASTADLELLLDMPLELLAPLVPASTDIQLQAGHVKGNVKANIARAGKQMEVDGNITLENFTYGFKDEATKTGSARFTIAAELLDLQQLELNDLTMQVTTDSSETAADLAFTGTYSFPEQAGKLNANVREVNQKVLTLLPSSLLNAVSARDLKTSGQLSLEIPADKQEKIGCTADISFSQLALSIQGFQPVPTIQGGLKMDLELDNNEVLVNNLETEWQHQEKQLLHLLLKGKAGLPAQSAPFAFELESNGIALRQLEALFVPVPNSSEISDSNDARPLESDRASPSPLKGINGTLKVDASNITYGDVLAEQFHALLSLENEKITLEKSEIQANAGLFAARGSYDFSSTKAPYDLVFNAENVTANPLLKTLAPELVSILSLEIGTVDLSASGTGLEPKDLRENLTATFSLALDALELSNLPPLQEAAEKWNIPELESLSFDSGEVLAKAADGVVQFQQIDAKGSNAAFEAKGRLTFEQELDFAIQAGVAGALSERLQRLELLRLFTVEQNGYSYFPVSIPLTGTLTEPELNRQVFQQRLLQALGAETLGRALGLEGEAAESIQEGLQKILGNEKNGEKNGKRDVWGGLMDIGIGVLEQKQKEEENETEPKSPAPDEQTPPQDTQESSEQPEVTPEDDLRKLGEGLLRNLLKPRNGN